MGGTWRHHRARTLLRERLNKTPLSELLSGLMKSLLSLLEGDTEGSIRHMETTDAARDPEILVYFARHYSEMGLATLAIDALKRGAQAGFVCAPETLNSDVWLEAFVNIRILDAVRGFYASGDCYAKNLSRRLEVFCDRAHVPLAAHIAPVFSRCAQPNFAEVQALSITARLRRLILLKPTGFC